MSWYRRVVLGDNRSKIAGLVRITYLQLASEDGETSPGCEKIDIHTVQSIRVPVACPECFFAKMEKRANKVANIRWKVSEIKTRLWLGTENNSNAAVVERVNANDGNETFSPLSISF